MVYLNKFLHTHPVEHCLTSGISNSFFGVQGFSEHQSRRLWPVSENAPYLLNPWYIWIKGVLTWYRKLTCGSVHAWNFMFINSLGYDFYIYGAFEFSCNSIAYL